MTDRHIHNIRRNHTNRMPRHHVFLDTESVRANRRTGETQRFRLAVACFYAAPKGRKPKESWARFTNANDLWSAVSAFCGPRHRTVVWAHNLGFDTRISEALLVLPALGWHLLAHNMANRGTWLAWRRDDASLVMVDSSSVFPTTVAQLGKWFGLGKEELPGDTDDAEVWFSRCETDVAILRASVLAYLRWLEREDLGNWQWTGAGQSWAAFRHRFMSHRLTVHDDGQALAAERRAMWTGRCEAFWHGTILYQELQEWDLYAAYTMVARDTAVPVRLESPMPERYPWYKRIGRSSVAALLECDVQVDVPCVPAEKDGRILWPTGRFKTTLWDIEAALVVENGGTVQVTRGWLYRTAPALKDMAEWILRQLDAPDDTAPAWVKAVCKHWGRAWIGRSGMTHHNWERFGVSPVMACRQWVMYDASTGTESTMMQVGYDVFVDKGTVEWSDSMPMIIGFVMAMLRVRMWRILSALPPGAALYCDTDSLFATDAHAEAVDAVSAMFPEWRLRVKRAWRGFTIEGPRQIVTGNQVRIAGVPVRAKRVGRREFHGEVWESLQKAIKEGRGREVRITPRRWELRGTDRRRQGNGVGWTTPYVLTG